MNGYFKRIIFTVFTQGILSMISVIIGFGLPRFLSLNEYARWQVYYFYVAYVNYLQFGFNDGLILNLSGKRFEEFPWKGIGKSIKWIAFYLVGLSLLVLGGSCILEVKDFEIICLLVLSFMPTILMCNLSALLLAGNKTYEYNLFNLLIRLAFVLLVIIGIILKINDAKFYISSDIGSKIIIVVVFYIYESRAIKGKRQPDNISIWGFIKENCKTGIVIATTVVILGLIPMCGRIVIQIVGNEKEYALYSFAISMLSIILTFTNAIGTVAFPLLKNFHYSLEKTYEIFSEIYEELVIICLAVLGIIDIVVTIFLPEYSSVLKFFPVLLAACWPLGEIESITYPYYKIYRKERQFLVIGICAISAVFLLSFAGYLIAGLTGLAWIVLLGISAFFIVLKINFCHKALNERYKCKVKSVSRIIFFIIVGVSLDGLKFLAIYLLGIFLCFLIFFREYRKLYLKIKNVS